MHKLLPDKLVNAINSVVGFFEVAFIESFQYKYVISSIKIEQDPTLKVLVKYRVVGSRQYFEAKATELNSTNLFASFRPDHAQMIVSIATVESLLLVPSEEIKNSLIRYISVCSDKIRG